jgi:hypothetical protein
MNLRVCIPVRVRNGRSSTSRAAPTCRDRGSEHKDRSRWRFDLTQNGLRVFCVKQSTIRPGRAASPFPPTPLPCPAPKILISVGCDVRFTPESGHWVSRPRCLLCAISDRARAAIMAASGSAFPNLQRDATAQAKTARIGRLDRPVKSLELKLGERFQIANRLDRRARLSRASILRCCCVDRT